MKNIQHRIVDAPAAQVGALLDRLAGPDDVLWPTGWPPLRLDRGLVPGSTGGHGPIRYAVSEYEPGRRLRFRPEPGTGLDGFHEFTVRPLDAGRCELVHVIRARTHGAMLIAWPLAVRWLHEALLQDLLDQAETAAARGPRRPNSWSPWVRLLRRWHAPRPARGPLPSGAELARSELASGEPATDEPATDGRGAMQVMDAWRLPVPAGAPLPPEVWRDAIFESPPAWVVQLMRLRNATAGLVGLDRAEPRHVFAERARTDDEVLLGGDGRHFDLRISVFVEPGAVVCCTLTRARSRRGRAYLALVGRVHPFVVRAMLARAGRSTATPRGGATVKV